ncbi:hypothetical protein BJ508DRAFT_218882 [Ascobolus immersus RN42]|uniref:Uncharacterized protein n=1 Tax=Ascobolus immersus RN42 TaxID=1160509 RepID=A0A3N4H7G0_ASCIM|nr:hypothetical protein BJ508DRAFT_218882 [Ascobolus immersus RN42]
MIEILDREVCDGIEVLLLYDVACRLEPFLKKRDPDGHLMKRLSIAVNKFHGYAHEYRCHELWGAQQRLGIGESDGEGTERVWAKLRVLVTAG